MTAVAYYAGLRPSEVVTRDGIPLPAVADFRKALRQALGIA